MSVFTGWDWDTDRWTKLIPLRDWCCWRGAAARNYTNCSALSPAETFFVTNLHLLTSPASQEENYSTSTFYRLTLIIISSQPWPLVWKPSTSLLCKTFQHSPLSHLERDGVFSDWGWLKGSVLKPDLISLISSVMYEVYSTTHVKYSRMSPVNLKLYQNHKIIHPTTLPRPAFSLLN